jgi:hypothetical protein
MRSPPPGSRSRLRKRWKKTSKAKAYERKLRRTAERVSGFGGVAVDVGVGLLLSGAGGVTGAVLGPVGVAAGIVGPTAITGAIAAKRAIGQRSARRWLGLDTRIRTMAG